MMIFILFDSLSINISIFYAVVQESAKRTHFSMAPPAGVAAACTPVVHNSDELTLKTYYKTKIEEAQVCFISRFFLSNEVQSYIFSKKSWKRNRTFAVSRHKEMS